MPRLGLGIRLRSTAPASAAPIISGTAYPLETLTSSIAGQWTVDGVPTGSPGTTFQVPLLAIGAVIRCGSSAPVTVWHPNQISAVVNFWMAAANVFASVSPNVAATNGQSVRRWTDIIAGAEANQSTGVNQPVYRSAGQGGLPSIEFDGSNDRLDLPASSATFQNKTQGYLFGGCLDSQPASGNGHCVAIYNNNATASRIGLFTKLGGSDQLFRAAIRRLDADAAAGATIANNGSYNVLAAHGDWSAGFSRLRVNGSAAASAAIASGSGSTSNTASTNSSIGGSADSLTSNPFQGHLTAICTANASMTATQVAQIERYIGLLGGLTTIPLV